MNSMPIVVVAFNRPNSLKRLLMSIEKANYQKNDIPLIISIDKGDNKDVLDIAEKFEWQYGEKIVSYQKENLKLRRHILKCGDLSLKYGSVIILEDDLFVSPDFYTYANKALEFTANDKRIGGVSLYNHKYNVVAQEPFEAFPDKYDNWYFQFASSWGEAWTAEQWTAFREWYEIHQNDDLTGNDIPDTVTNWSSSSWLKYFIKYLVTTDKYFIYPRESLTTNFSDAGTHISSDDTNFQVPLRRNGNFVFATIDESSAVYDAFFENVNLPKSLEMNKENVEIDLYGTKKRFTKRYVISRQRLDYKVISGYACSMRPIDANIIYKLQGNDLLAYDTDVSCRNSFKRNYPREIRYSLRNFPSITYWKLMLLFIKEAKDYIKKKIK